MTRSPATDQTFHLHGVDLSYPISVRSGHSLMGLFPVRADVANRHLQPHGLRAAEIGPGRAMLSLAGVRYIDTDLGAYDELALSFFVRMPGPRRGIRVPYLSTWSQIIRGRIPSFCWRLPVTSEMSQDAGAQMWGFPKTVEDVEVDVLAGRATVTWKDRHDLILRYGLEAEGDRTLGPISPPVVTTMDGATHVSRLTQTYREVGRNRPGGELQLGNHPIADELRELGVKDQAMLGVWNGQLAFEMSAPTAV